MHLCNNIAGFKNAVESFVSAKTALEPLLCSLFLPLTDRRIGNLCKSPMLKIS